MDGFGVRMGNTGMEEWDSWTDAKEHNINTVSLLYFKIGKHNEILCH